jgi:uncharacterized protein
MEFTREVIDDIGYYVYLYIDPRNNQIFYIGQGNGNRAFHHLHSDDENEKVKKIEEIKECQLTPIIEILRYNLKKEEAENFEAVAIDTIGIKNLTNLQRGNECNSSGRINAQDLIDNLSAKPINIEKEHKIMAITINRNYQYSHTSPEALYEYTRGIWRVGKNKREKVDFAFAVYHGVVKEVYKIKKWLPAGTLIYKHHDSSGFKNTKRWEFDGEIADETICKKYKGKSIRHYIKKGSQNPIRYINL